MVESTNQSERVADIKEQVKTRPWEQVVDDKDSQAVDDAEALKLGYQAMKAGLGIEDPVNEAQQKSGDLAKIESGGIHTNNKTTVKQYFNYYSKLVNQQNMMQDEVRTKLYRDAILLNPSNFAGKIVMDVGAGSGILSLFAAQAGAKKVYAVEASSMAENARILIKANGYEKVITVLCSRVEDLTETDIPEKQVDVIVSEPLGTFLLNERMLETYVIARNIFLKPGGRMFPAKADFCVIPFTDQEIYDEQMSKVAFWKTKDFYGLDVSEFYQKAVEEKFAQPILDTFEASKNLADNPFRRCFDFEKCTIADLQTVNLVFKHRMNRAALLHGYAIYFDAIFSGDDHYCVLHTGPDHPATHWYQTRLLLPEPLGVNKNQFIDGRLEMKANTEQTYDTVLTCTIPQLEIEGQVSYDMKDAEYRGCYQSYADYYNGGTNWVGDQNYQNNATTSNTNY